jgi:hypothetical protein
VRCWTILLENIMTATRIIVVVVSCALVASCSRSAAPNPSPSLAGAADPVADLAAGFDGNVRRDLATLRDATNAFHDLAVAQAAGHPSATPACVADSTLGGMGRHYFDRKIYDDTVDISHPEMLIYAPTPDGKQKLVGVEYVIPFRLRPATATPPRLFGQNFKPHEQYQYWYLHVWAWEKNSAGLFADWNPAVKCI